MLIIFAGLPGSGKSTLARMVALRMQAVYLRVDTIEQAMHRSGFSNEQIGGVGYGIGYSIATENLRLGRTVVADTVNPWEQTRDEWRKAAIDAGTSYLDVEVVCSDPAEHLRRVESRESDIEGHALPSWQEVIDRDYHPFKAGRLVIDTFKLSPEEAVDLILQALEPLAL